MESRRFSTRTDWDRTPNALAACHAALLRSGEPILDLTESNPTRCGFAYPASEILAALSDPAGLTYEPDPRGSREAREAVARSFAERGRAVDPDRIVLCASTSEAYSWLFKLLCEEGDQVLIPAPSYPLFSFLAQLEGVGIASYPLRYDGRWSADPEEVAGRCGPRTRAVVVVQPNNPTGSLLAAAEFEELARACAARGIAIISDEVFADYTFRGAGSGRPASALDVSGALVFVLGGLSKAVGLPQMKLSWIAAGGPPAVVAEALGRLEIIGDTFLSVGTPVQSGLGRILEAGRGVRDEVRGRVRANQEWLAARRGPRSTWECLRAEGGWYAVLRVPRVKEDLEWAVELLERERVFVHPGSFFDFATDGYLIVSLLPPRELFEEGAGRLIDRVQSVVG